MNILFIGDIFGSPGRRIVADHLQDIVQSNRIDLTIANAENAAGGFGITPSIAEELFALGLDVLTSGNHVWDKRELYDYFARQPRLLRPANYPEAPGRCAITYRARNGTECAVINLQGRTYMPATDCPFRKADQLLSELDPAVKVRFVGIHTHVPTADTRILAGGTAYQTDCGMTGPYHSVIGVQTDIVIQRFLTGRPVRMEAARTGPELHAVIVDVDEATGKARAVRRHAIDGD